MEIKLIKNWTRKGRNIEKGKVLEVTQELARDLIKKKIAKPVRETVFTRLLKKDVPEDGTKQTARKRKVKQKEED
jgi:hypothetical protein